MITPTSSETSNQDAMPKASTSASASNAQNPAETSCASQPPASQTIEQSSDAESMKPENSEAFMPGGILRNENMSETSGHSKKNMLSPLRVLPPFQSDEAPATPSMHETGTYEAADTLPTRETELYKTIDRLTEGHKHILDTSSRLRDRVDRFDELLALMAETQSQLLVAVDEVNRHMPGSSSHTPFEIVADNLENRLTEVTAALKQAQARRQVSEHRIGQLECKVKSLRETRGVVHYCYAPRQVETDLWNLMAILILVVLVCILVSWYKYGLPKRMVY